MTSEPHGSVSFDQRPVYRIAVFGLGHRFQRLLEIIIRHARHNRYRYELAEQRGPGDFDIALVDMTARGGAEVAKTLRSVPRALPVVGVGRRGNPRRAPDDLLFATFSLDVLGVLNKAAQTLSWRERAERLSTRLIQPEPAQRVPRIGGRSPRALVVDPSTSVRSQIAVALRQIGVDAEGVGSLAQAEDVLTIRSYELILLEPEQPDGDGIAMLRRFRRESTLSVPVVVLSARAGVRDLARAAWVGCSGYLGKPVALSTLHQTVSRVLHQSLKPRWKAERRAAEAAARSVVLGVGAAATAGTPLSGASDPGRGDPGAGDTSPTGPQTLSADTEGIATEGPMTIWRRAFGERRRRGAPVAGGAGAPAAAGRSVDSAIEAMADRSARQPTLIRPLRELLRR